MPLAKGSKAQREFCRQEKKLTLSPSLKKQCCQLKA